MAHTKNTQLNFSKLINEYKQENFKKMPILHHEFIYACFHPSMEDCVIALEKNYYPVESELYNLTKQGNSYYEKVIKHLEGLNDPEKIRKFAQLAGVDKRVLTIVTEEDNAPNEQVKPEDIAFGISDKKRDGNQVESSAQLTESNRSKSRRMNNDEIMENSRFIQEQLKAEILKKIKVKERLFSQIQPLNMINDKQEQQQQQQQTGQNIRKQSVFRSAPKNQNSLGLSQIDKEQIQDTIKPKDIADSHINAQISQQMHLNQLNLATDNKPLRASLINGKKEFNLKEEEDSSQEFGFLEPQILKEQKLERTSKRKFGISIWKLNRGQQAYQIDEHPFNMYPVGQKFFLSHDSKHIVVFLINDQDKEDFIGRIRILDINTLKCLKDIDRISSLQIQSNTLIDAALVWDSKYLYFQTLQDSYFINVNSQEIDYTFVLEAQVDGFQNQFKHAMFKENEHGIMYAVVYQQKSDESLNKERYQLYKVRIDRSEFIFDPSNFESLISKGAISYNGTIGYNRSLNQIVFPGEQVYCIYSRTMKQNHSINYRNVQNCQVQKNGFLFDHIWILYNDDNYDTFTSSTKNLQVKYPISDLDLDDFRLGDVIREKTAFENEHCIFAIGKKGENEAASRICINVAKPDDQFPFVNYIQETSDYVFFYPYIIYCKGNQELFLQCLHQPEKLVKLDLEESFVCFVELNSSAKLKPMHLAIGTADGNFTFRKYESISFLTQNEDKMFLNILEYSPYGLEKDYILYKSLQSIERPKCKTFRGLINIVQSGNIIRAVFQRAKHKECKDHDYIIILQYRNQIVIRSFFNLFVLNIDKFIFKFPLIYLPSKKNLPDVCFFVSKDGYSTKVERISFNGKETKDPLSTMQELKTSNIFIFSYHDGHFYIMDDSQTLKQYQYDKRAQKFKYIRLFEFGMDNRDYLAQPVDFTDIQVTSKGVYRGLMFYPFFEQNIFKKDINMIKTDPILSIPDIDLFAGPKKLHHTRYILYIARGDQRIISNLTQPNSEEQQIHGENEDENVQIQDNSLKEDESLEEDDEHFSEYPHSKNFPIDSPPKRKLVQDLKNFQNDYSLIENKGKLEDPDPYPKGFKNQEQILRSKSASQTSKKPQIFLDQLDDQSSQDNVSQIRIPFGVRKNTKTQFQSKKSKLLNDGMSKLNKIQTKKGSNTVTQFQAFFQNYKKKKTLINQNLQNEQKIHVNPEGEQVYAWIVPYLDSNVIHFTHNPRENDNPRFVVTFSTFINNQDEVLLEMNKTWYLYSKNGTLIYELNVDRRLEEHPKSPLYFLNNNLKLENLSPNMQYFMFHNQEKELFEVFELCRVQIEEKSFINSISKQQFQKLKSRNITMFSSNFNTNQNYDKYCQPYYFRFVKTVKEMQKIYLKEDYFNKPSLSNKGEIFQLVQVELNAYNFTPETQKDKGSSYHQPYKIYSQSHVEDINDLPEFNSDKNVFQFYIDEDEKPELADKFSLVKEHLKNDIPPEQELVNFGYQVLNEYLFIKRETKLEFLRIFSREINTSFGESRFIYKPSSLKAKFIRLILDKNAEIQRLMTTCKSHLIQLIVVDERFLYVITWDIEKNMEHYMMQIEKSFNYNAGHIVCKGLTEMFNYIPLGEAFYDLYYSLPFKFFESSNQWHSQIKQSMNMNERKLSRFNREYLDQFENNKIFKSFSYLDLCYMRGLQSMNQDKIQQNHIMVEHLHIRVKGLTVFSMFALDSHLLKEISDEIIKVDEQMNSSSNQEQISISFKKWLFLNILYPNYFNKNAFDVAMEKSSPKSIEIMLDDLSNLQGIALSKFLLPHFSELFQMEIVAFQNYLSTCYFQLPRMSEIRVLKWNRHEDEYFIDYHTSYLGEDFYKKLQFSRFNYSIIKDEDQGDDHYYPSKTEMRTDQTEEIDENEKIDLIENYQQNLSLEESNPKSLNKKLREFLDGYLMNNQAAFSLYEPDENIQWKQVNQSYQIGEYKRIETSAIEFDWIFRGQSAIKFIEHLAVHSNDTIFGVFTIKIIINFLWQRFFYNIRNKIFIPFVVYFLLFFVQVTFVYAQRITMLEAQKGLNEFVEFDEDQYFRLVIADQVLIALILALCLYFIVIEVRQMISLKSQYLKGFWNWLDMASIGLNLAYLVMDICNVKAQYNRVVSSVAILLMWLKLLYFLKLFAPTAALIRMIVEIFKDVFVFLVIYFIAIIGFANAVYILSFNLDQENFEDLFDYNFLLAILYSYRQGLGDFDTSNIEDSRDQQLWYILFVAQTIFIQIVLLNLLIAIMGDTFDKVTEKKEESKLREICEMMCDYEYVVDREKEFKYSKYIIVNKVEKAETNLTQDWEGRLGSLKTHFQTLVSELKRETKQLHENLRDEVIGNAKSMEQKFLDLQSFVMKQSSQMSVMMKKMDKIGDNVSVINKNTRFLSNDHLNNMKEENKEESPYDSPIAAK